jgi:integrase
MTLGKWPLVTAKLARDNASKAAAKVALGQDPQKQKEEDRRAKTSVGEVIDRYLQIKAGDLRPRSLIEVERHLNVHAKPLHSLAVEHLEPDHVSELLTAIANSSGPIAANRVRASLRAALTWALKNKKTLKAKNLQTNAAGFTDAKDERPRERVLSDAELAALWSKLGGDDFSAIVRLLILTAQRREEIGGLKWSEVDLKNKIIRLPADRVKNGNAHTVPMSDAVKAILAAIPKTEGRNLVFGEGASSFSGYAKCKRRLDAQLPEVAHWTLHESAADGSIWHGQHRHTAALR